MHLQKSLHGIPAWQHSQQFFWQRLFGQVHTLVGIWCQMLSNMLLLERSLAQTFARDIWLWLSSVFLHPSQKQPSPQNFPVSKHPQVLFRQLTLVHLQPLGRPSPPISLLARSDLLDSFSTILLCDVYTSDFTSHETLYAILSDSTSWSSLASLSKLEYFRLWWTEQWWKGGYSQQELLSLKNRIWSRDSYSSSMAPPSERLSLLGLLRFLGSIYYITKPTLKGPNTRQSVDSKEQSMQGRVDKSKTRLSRSCHVVIIMDIRVQEATRLKTEGNTLFHQANYSDALKCYTKAIQLDPLNSILFSNRARCNKLLNRLSQSLEDSSRALQLDSTNVKAHLLTGEVLLDLAIMEKDPDKVQKAIAKLKKSLTMSSGNKMFEVPLQEKIYRARKNLWEVKLESELAKKKFLKSLMSKLVEEDSDLGDEQKDSYHQKVAEMLDLNIKTDKFTIPSELVCSLSNQVMKDPVCNQHGHTYCRQPYLNHLKTNRTDPKTRKPILLPTQLYSNVNLRKAIDEFFELNIWAYEHTL